MWACDCTAVSVLHIPIDPSFISSSTQLFLCLFLIPGRSHHSIVALIPSQHSLGQFCVQVLQFSALLGCLFLLSSFLRLTTTSNRLWASKPNCRGHPNGARLPLVHSQCWCKLLFGPFFLAPALHNTPASFLQTTTARYPTGNKITDRVAVTRIHNTPRKHTLERTASPLHKQVSPRCVQRTTEQSR